MHSLLETYLSEVAGHLGALPAKRRAEELREMRAHLENAALVSRELGQTEDEAAANAVAQFGAARDLGENVVWAWRRGEMLNRKSFFGATAATTLVLCLMAFLMDGGFDGLLYSALERLLPHAFLLYCGKHEAYGMALTRGMFLASFGLAGLVAGSLFPKRAVRGACLGLALFWVGWAAVDGVGRGGVWSFLFYGDRAGWMLAAVVSAWAGSRSRLAWGRRRRAARG